VTIPEPPDGTVVITASAGWPTQWDALIRVDAAARDLDSKHHWFHCVEKPQGPSWSWETLFKDPGIKEMYLLGDKIK